ncbi:MAG: prepilin-type N-terminal cleavage/methylation domain-containing protein [Proteobacteria bacterium]|nr:prepilin-type N-terminal cleavage/methylation domain-containing protein [Pseudomonadota bacterium]
MKTRHTIHLGFTLIELLVTIAIIAVIAIPSYNDFMERARCSDGQEALTSIAQSQERFYLNNYSYTTSFATLGYGTAGTLSSEGYYTLSLGACTTGFVDTCAAITATGTGVQSDTNTLSLNTRGRKSHTLGAATLSGWVCN